MTKAPGDMAPERPTLQTIADLTGLAKTTVSRALGDAPDIAERTKVRVRQVARDVGYSPDPAARRLRTGRTGAVTLLLPIIKTINNMTAVLLRELSQNFFERGFRLSVTPTFADDSLVEPVRSMVNSGLVDGLILNQTQRDDPRVAYLLDANFPFVTHGRTAGRVAHSYFDFDNRAFGKLAGDLLQERGRRQILMILPPPEQMFSSEILDGIRSSVWHPDATLMRLEGCDGEAMATEIGQALRRHVARHGFPDAVVTYSSGAAIETMALARVHGRVIGQHFDLVAKDCEEIMSKTSPGLIIAHENIPLAAEFLCKALLHAIENPGAAPMQGLETPTALIAPPLPRPLP